MHSSTSIKSKLRHLSWNRRFKILFNESANKTYGPPFCCVLKFLRKTFEKTVSFREYLIICKNMQIFWRSWFVLNSMGHSNRVVTQTFYGSSHFRRNYHQKHIVVPTSMFFISPLYEENLCIWHFSNFKLDFTAVFEDNLNTASIKLLGKVLTN